MEYYVLQSALDNYNDLQKKVSSEMKDWDEYVNKKFKVIKNNFDGTYIIQYKNLIAKVAKHLAYTPFDIIDENTGEVLYQDMTPEKIRKDVKPIREISLNDSIFDIDIKGDGIEFTGRDKILEMLEESFLKKRMKNTILIGKAGCGKTKIVQELAKRLAGEYIILEWRISSLISNTQLRGTLEAKAERILKQVLSYNTKNKKKIVLFIDEIHTMVGGLCVDDSCHSVTIQDMLKPYLTNPDMILIGATTPDEYQKSIFRDKALRRRLCPIYVDELPYDTIKQILIKFSDNMIEESLIEYVYNRSKELKDTANPDISIEIIDRLLAKKKKRNTEITKEVIDDVIDFMKNVEKY